LKQKRSKYDVDNDPIQSYHWVQCEQQPEIKKAEFKGKSFVVKGTIQSTSIELHSPKCISIELYLIQINRSIDRYTYFWKRGNLFLWFNFLSQFEFISSFLFCSLSISISLDTFLFEISCSIFIWIISLVHFSIFKKISKINSIQIFWRKNLNILKKYERFMKSEGKKHAIQNQKRYQGKFIEEKSRKKKKKFFFFFVSMFFLFFWKKKKKIKPKINFYIYFGVDFFFVGIQLSYCLILLMTWKKNKNKRELINKKRKEKVKKSEEKWKLLVKRNELHHTLK